MRRSEVAGRDAGHVPEVTLFGLGMARLIMRAWNGKRAQRWKLREGTRDGELRVDGAFASWRSAASKNRVAPKNDVAKGNRRAARYSAALAGAAPDQVEFRIKSAPPLDDGCNEPGLFTALPIIAISIRTAPSGRSGLPFHCSSSWRPSAVVGNFRSLFALTGMAGPTQRRGASRAKQKVGEFTWQSRREGGQRRQLTTMSGAASASVASCLG